MKFIVIIEKGNKSYGAYVPDLPGCVAVAETEIEVKELIQTAIEFHLESLRNDKIRIPRRKSKAIELEVAM